jgi:hypothetical protein
MIDINLQYLIAQYIGDYDADEYKVKANPNKFKAIIRHLLTLNDVYIGDIKCGEMNGEPIRWTPKEVLKGRLVMGDHEHTLADCIRNPGLFKLDVIAFIDTHYTELSIIYFKTKTSGLSTQNLIEQLKTQVSELYNDGMYYKMSKRIFSISRQLKDSETAKNLLPLYNGDLGRLYSIISDIDVLLYLFDNNKHIPRERLFSELDNLKTRMANIWNLSKFIKNEDEFIDTLVQQINKQNPKALHKLNEQLFKILNFYAKEDLTNLKLFPPPAKYLP